MAHRQLEPVLRYLRRFAGTTAADQPETDRELLRRFARGGDQAAFARLVERHGAMVLAVCQRRLGDAHAAEDVFQAVFLVLARRAGAVPWRDSIGNWLYGVAYRIALKAQKNAARRHTESLREEAMNLPVDGPDSADNAARRELGSVLDEELSRLPHKYRAPLVLCYLEGKTNEEAAQHLGWTKGTVSGRLARARELLHGRLTRRGLAVSVPVLGALLATPLQAAHLSAPLTDTTIQAAVLFAAGKPAGVSAEAVALAQGALNMIKITRMVVVLSVLLSAVALGLGGPFLAGALWAARPGDGRTVPECAVVTADAQPARALVRLGSNQLRHTAGIHAVAISSDGKLVASGSEDHTIRVWETATGKERLSYRAPADAQGFSADRLAFSPDGKYLAAGDAAGYGSVLLWDLMTDKTFVLAEASKGRPGHVGALVFISNGKALAGVYGTDLAQRASVWDVESRKERSGFDPGLNRFGEFAISPDGKMLAAMVWDTNRKPGFESFVQLWDLQSGKESGKLESERVFRPLLFATDGQALLTGAGDGALLRWDLKAGKAEKQTYSKVGQLSDAALSADGKRLAFTLMHEPETLRLWDLAAGNDAGQIQTKHGLSGKFALSTDGKLLVSGGEDSVVRIWDAIGTKPLLPNESGHAGRVVSVSFSADGRSVITAGTDGTVRLWDATTGKERRVLATRPAYKPPQEATVDLRVGSSADRRFAAWSGADGKVHIADLNEREETATVPGDMFEFAPDGNALASWGADGVIQLSDSATGKKVNQLSRNGTIRVRFAPDGKSLVTDSSSGLEQWLLPDGKAGVRFRQTVAEKLSGKLAPIPNLPMGSRAPADLPVKFSTDGRFLAAVSRESGMGRGRYLWDTIEVWSIDGKPVYQVKKDGPATFEFTPDSRFLIIMARPTPHIVGDTRKELVFRNLQTGEERNSGIVSSLTIAFTPDGQSLVTGTDGTIRLWDASGQKERLTLPALVSPATGFAISADGTRLATAHADSTVQLWGLRPRQ